MINSDNRFNKDWDKMWNDMISNDGKIDLPDSYDYIPTLRCNLNCRGCCQSHCTKYNELKFDEFRTVYDKLDINNKIVKLIGGEIFVRNDIPNMLNYLTKKNANIIVATNAYKTPEPTDFLKWNIVEITTSIDGLARTHDNLRGKQGSFNQIRKFATVMGNYGLGYKVLSSTMVHDYNIKEMDSIMKLKDILGIERMRFQIPKWCTQEEIDGTLKILGKESLLDVSRYPYTYTPQEFEDNVIRPIAGISGYYIQPEYAMDGFKVNKDAVNKQFRKKHKCMCKYLFRGKINPDGEVNPCFHILNKMGNLKDKSLEEIWNSKEYCKLRMDLANNNLTPMCENCCSIKVLK
jgi:MoaA/NifB/PqqE/SkfB family radical SAM enzyme